ncbi:MAG TPA: protein kinase [Candidatus Sulfotelmatobacter sp.]|nr:protein kinase [Candidatus Sulfotelmatobacter sp.]
MPMHRKIAPLGMIGQLVGHYRVLEKIGAGGMGEVFRARDERLGRDVALKLIRPASSDNPDHLRRFEQEARAAAALNHPNILAIYDVGFQGSTPYIVSELLVGKTLRQCLAEGPISTREAAGYAIQMAQALIAAHERHIVHRDLKPENLFLTTEGRIKILDFGVAKLQPPVDEGRSIENLTTVTKHGAVIGTVAYMSPEQLRGKPVDHRSDIFSFGAILYEMLTGIRAFRGETEVDTMTAVLREEPSSAVLDEATIPAGYQDVIRHCLEKEPENRFQSVKDLTFALQTISGSSPVRVSPLAPKPSRASVLPWVVATVMAVATVALAAALLLQRPNAPPAYRRITFEAGTIYGARFAADGQSIIYGAAWNGKPVQLFSTVGSSLLAQPLNLNNANLLAVSPTNELAVVLNGTHDGQLEIVNGVLARAPLAGGSPREVLSDVRWADWDAHGQLAVVHYVESHCRLEFPIGNVLYQSNGWISHIRFSPRGDQIAFMDHHGLWDNRGVVSVVDLLGHARNLSGEWDSEAGLAWRPDGEEIWFTAAEKGNTRNLMAVNLSGRIRMLLDLPVGMTLQDIASDGRVLVSLDSARLAVGFTTLGRKGDADISWHDWESARDISPDGQSVLFEDASEAAGTNYSVVIRKVDGTLPVRLGEGSSGGLSPDGEWAISFATSQLKQLTLLPTGTGQPRTINVTGLEHIHNGWGRFLPNGQKIIVNGDQSGRPPRCYEIEVSTGKATAATPEGFLCGASSPDSQAILGKGPGGALAIYPMNGGAPKPLPNSDAKFSPVQWSDDGRFIYGYHAGEFPSRVYKLAIESGKESFVQELRPGAPAGVVMVAPIVVSRDGKRFAYSYNQTLSALNLISGLH